MVEDEVGVVIHGNIYVLWATTCGNLYMLVTNHLG